jgi:serine protease AprX
MLAAYRAFPTSSSVTYPTTGIVYTDQYVIFTVGAGYLDIQAALNDTNIATGTALSPTVSFDSSSGNVYLSTDPSAVWNTRSMWGTQSVWGAFVLDATQSVWRNQSAWHLDAGIPIDLGQPEYMGL